jgi:hypothetical protein
MAPESVLTIQACCSPRVLLPEKLARERKRTRFPSADITGFVQPSSAETRVRSDELSSGLTMPKPGVPAIVWNTTMLAESSIVARSAAGNHCCGSDDGPKFQVGTGWKLPSNRMSQSPSA